MTTDFHEMSLREQRTLNAALQAKIDRLTAALADERRHADALAEAVDAMDLCNKLDCEMRDNVLRAHRARRQA